MRSGLSAAVLAVILSLSGGPALAAVCRDKSMTSDEIVDAIDATGGCERAMKLFQDCQFGTSGDVQLGAAVEKKCEGDFLRRLNTGQRQTYRRELGVCDRKYRNESGTMYHLSFTAFCRAGGRPALLAAGAEGSGPEGPLAERLRPRAPPWPSRRSPGTPPAR